MERGELTGAILDGRYRVIEPVAEGAMGVVYRAERVKLGRIVAIKVLHDVLPGELSARKRFEIEARAMAKLEHPHCASVLDVGIHDGRPYVVMDFVSGQNLKDLVAEGPQPVGRAVELVRQVLSGLAHAHEHGIIHRDIKPANIVLSQKTGLGDHVKVLDFGLARLHDTGQNLTTGIVVGTPAYMAPEQIRGVVLDHRVDLYACGILLFELLTGVKPFHSEHDDPIEVCRMHLSAPIPRLDAKLRGEFGELEIIVARALAKDADDRYATAQAFVAALDAVAPRRPSMPPLALSAPSVPPGGYGSSVPAGPPVSSQAPVTTDGIQLASADVMSASDVSESSVLEVRSADVMSARSADSPQGEPALHRGGTVAGVVPARTATPVAGVPQRRTATPVAGVAQGRTATPVAGVAQGRTATPVAGVAVFAGEWAEPVSPPGTFLGIAVTPRAATAHRQASQMETEPSSATPGASPAMVRVPTSAGTPAAALGLPAPAQLPGAEPSPDAAPRSGRPSTSAGSSPAGPSERPSSPAGPSARPSSPAGPSERPSVSSFNGHLPDEVLVGATPGSAPGVAGGAPAGGVSVDRSAGAPGNATSTPAPAARWLARHTRVVMLAGGAVVALIVIVIVAIAASHGGTAQAPPDAGVAATSTPPPPPADPIRDILDRANELVAEGNRDAALDLLARSRRQYPDKAALAYTAGKIYFSKYYWSDGLKSFRDALRADPAYRTDPELIKTVLRGFLITPSYNEELASFLREDIGAAAQSFLEETARDHPNPELRRRAAAELRRYH